MMRSILCLLISIHALFAGAQTNDNVVYICKYIYTVQKDSTDKIAIARDLMCLNIGKESSNYYSYLKQLGLQNAAADIAAKKPLDQMMKNQQNYYAESESEIITHIYALKKRKVLIKFRNVYCYTEDTDVPNWKIQKETVTILNQVCQKAITFFKGRNYTAWFAASIPYRLGPWKFTGLPGLILRISDDREQFVFECTELIKGGNEDIYREYPNCIQAPRKKIEELKKLYVTDKSSFDQIEWGVSSSINNADGSKSPYRQKTKPYNPIDLSYIY